MSRCRGWLIVRRRRGRWDVVVAATLACSHDGRLVEVRWRRWTVGGGRGGVRRAVVGVGGYEVAGREAVYPRR